MGSSPVWVPAMEESCEGKKSLIRKVLRSLNAYHHSENWSILQVIKEEVFWGPALALGGEHQSRDSFSCSLSCTIKQLAAFLPALQEKKQWHPRREVLNRHGMRNFLRRTLSHHCMRETGQETCMGEAGHWRAVFTGELCEPASIRLTPGRRHGECRGEVETQRAS